MKKDELKYEIYKGIAEYFIKNSNIYEFIVMNYPEFKYINIWKANRDSNFLYIKRLYIEFIHRYGNIIYIVKEESCYQVRIKKKINKAICEVCIGLLKIDNLI